MARRIGGAGGGSDKGGGGTVLLAVGVALALGAGGASVAGSTATSGASSGARSGSRVDNRTSQALETRLTSRGIRLTSRITDDDADCVAHSYGQVQDFLRRSPCTALHRAQFELRDRNGDVVLLAVSWVEMSSEAAAGSLRELLDTEGTGNIIELSRERGRYRTIRYGGDAYASSRDGTVVATAQAEPIARRTSGLVLTTIVNEAVQ